MSLADDIRALFDYRGDCARGNRRYHKDYSPNNIRSVVISTNGVLVTLHRPISNLTHGKGTKTLRYIEFRSDMLMKLEQEKGYRPILHYLANPVCSSLEEVIVLTGTDGVQNPMFYGLETELSGLVKTYEGAGATVVERVKNRFGRLRYFTVMSCSFHQFITFAIQNQKLFVGGMFMSEIPALEGQIMSREEVNPEDEWWRNYGNQPTYAYDSGMLAPYFKKVIADKELEIKNSKIGELKEKATKKEVDDLNKMLADYVRYTKVCRTFVKCLSDSGSNGLLDFDGIETFKVSKVYSFDGIEGVPKSLISEQKVAEPMKENVKIVEGIEKKVAMYLSDLLIKSICMQDEKVIGVLLHDCETSVMVTPEAMKVFGGISKKYGFTFDGKKFRSSIINSAWLFCKFFLDRSADKYNARYTAREYWKGVVESGY